MKIISENKWDYPKFLHVPFSDKQLIFEVGDLIHGVSGFVEELDDEKSRLRRYIVHIILSSCMKNYYKEDGRERYFNPLIVFKRDKFTSSLTEEQQHILAKVLIQYSNGTMSHVQMVVLCQLLLFDWDLKRAVTHIMGNAFIENI